MEYCYVRLVHCNMRSFKIPDISNTPAKVPIYTWYLTSKPKLREVSHIGHRNVHTSLIHVFTHKLHLVDNRR